MGVHEASGHEFASGEATACVLAKGAELCSLRDRDAIDYLWPAEPIWPRHAPILFPIVGRLPNDQLTHAGRTYRLTQHGFARDRLFTWVERSASGCLLALTDDGLSRAMYPFSFRFEVRYALLGATLDVSFTVINSGEEVLPASMGAHPAFRWPLQANLPKDTYSLTFDAEETTPLRSLSGGLLTPVERFCPVQGRQLSLNEALFADDALIFPSLASRSVRYAAKSGPGLTVAWEGFPQLGVWSRLGGNFVCIEPWHGMATPERFTGGIFAKARTPANSSRRAAYRNPPYHIGALRPQTRATG